MAIKETKGVVETVEKAVEEVIETAVETAVEKAIETTVAETVEKAVEKAIKETPTAPVPSATKKSFYKIERTFSTTEGKMPVTYKAGTFKEFTDEQAKRYAIAISKAEPVKSVENVAPKK